MHVWVDLTFHDGVSMYELRILAASLLSITLLGCGSESDIKSVVRQNGSESEIKLVVRQNLRDPDSAKFGKIVAFDVKDADGRVEKRACATVNAKNSFGGYVGDKQAYLRKKEGGSWEFILFSDHGLDDCIGYLGGKTK